MSRFYRDIESYKTIILQELILEQYYLSNQDAIEHLYILEDQIKIFFNEKTPIPNVLKWIMTYEYCLK